MKKNDTSVINSKRANNNTGINPVTLMIIVFSLMLTIVFSASIYYCLTILVLFWIFSIMNDLFNKLFLSPLNQFKIFIIFSTVFMLISNYSVVESANYTLKIIILLLLSSMLNQILDYSYILSYFDFYLSRSKPLFFRIYSRKVLYSFILGLRSVSELFKTGSNLQRQQKLRRSNTSSDLRSKLAFNISLLRNLFIQSFYIAKYTDNYFTVHGFSFSKKRSFYLKRRFYLKDLLLIIISITLVII
ncbi:MAG: hypothetical protein JXR69_02485 [Candidatus Delongbacteria bacterium]|nr:hypothetical protein [Candidatus Delongbacteria bacterium]